VPQALLIDSLQNNLKPSEENDGYNVGADFQKLCELAKFLFSSDSGDRRYVFENGLELARLASNFK
jgi:hypothetical protein